MRGMYRWEALAPAVCAICLQASPADAANKARISALGDVSFGTITNFAADSVRAQDVCVYSKSAPADNYRVTATGSGPGGEFALSSGIDTLSYDVLWSDTAGQASGFQLSPNSALTGQHSTAGADDCSKGPATTASLVIIVRSAAMASAIAGSYSGSLTLLITPE
jgi:hypothetical protein